DPPNDDRAATDYWEVRDISSYEETVLYCALGRGTRWSAQNDPQLGRLIRSCFYQQVHPRKVCPGTHTRSPSFFGQTRRRYAIGWFVIRSQSYGFVPPQSSSALAVMARQSVPGVTCFRRFILPSNCRWSSCSPRSA